MRTWRILLIALMLVQTASLGVLAADKTLYDDFSSTYIDGVKWNQREFVRVVENGVLVSKVANDYATERIRNGTTFVNSDSIESISCEITLTDIILDSGSGAWSFARVEGVLYNAEGAGGTEEMIWAGLFLGDRGSGLEAYWYVERYQGDPVNDWVVLGSGTLLGPGMVSLGIVYPVVFSYDGDRTITFSVNGVSDTFLGPEKFSDTVGTDKALTTGINTTEGDRTGYAGAEFDNVMINGGGYDDFSTSPLDSNKWLENEYATDLDAGELRLYAQTRDEQGQTILAPANLACEYLEASVAIESGSYLSPGATAIARIGGFYLNDSYGPGSGLEYNFYEGNIWADNRLILDDTGQMRARCSLWREDDTGGQEIFGQEFNLAIQPDVFYRLSIYFDGSKFVFGCDDQSYEYELTTPAYPPYEGYHRQLRSRVYADPGEFGYVKARFDDVYLSPDDYLVYSKFNPDSIADVVQVGGYVEDYGVPTTWGDEIQYLYFLSGTIGYKVRVWLTDSEEPDDPTAYIEPRQHPDHPRFPGPIEPRHFEIVSSGELSPYIAGSGWHKEEFHVDSSGIYIGAFPNGIHKFDHDWNYVGKIAEPPPVTTETLAYDSVGKTWFAGGRYRTIFQLSDTDGDGDYLNESWQSIFTYPSYAGGHHDGMEYAYGFLWISDMTSDLIGQWHLDPGDGFWKQVEVYTYTNPDYVEGMGFGPNNHFWCGSGWGDSAYLYELGDDITTKYPVAAAGEDVPDHPPLVEIEFDASGSYHQNPAKRIILYEWDFDGDGVYDYTGSDPVTTHSYPAVFNGDGSIDWDATSRDYTAILRVTDDTPVPAGGPLMDSAVRVVRITAPPWKPVADPNGPYNARVNEPVDLDGTASYDPESVMYEPDHPWYEELSYHDWDLDNDGEFDDAAGPVVQWWWPSEGNYFVCLKVSDSEPSGPGGTLGNLDTDTKCTVVVISAVHDVAIDSIEPSSNQTTPGNTIAVSAALYNHGDYSEDCSVELYVEDQVVDSQIMTGLAPETGHEMTLHWDTTGFVEGSYTVKACVNPVPGEITTENNCKESPVALTEVISVFLDIKPGSCPNAFNVTNKGILPAAILGSPDLDVRNIIPDSIRFSLTDDSNLSIAPIRWSYEDAATPFAGEPCACHDLNGDGYEDLSLKFLSQELVQSLGLGDYPDDMPVLKVRGILSTGDSELEIEGFDCLWLIH